MVLIHARRERILLLYIYSYAKIGLELCNVFRTHSSQKTRSHGFYSKRILWQCHFLSFFPSFFLSFSLSFYSEFFYLLTENGGPGSSVGIATDYGLDGPGSNPGGDEIFRPPGPALRPTQSPVKRVPGLSRG